MDLLMQISSPRLLTEINNTHVLHKPGEKEGISTIIILNLLNIHFVSSQSCLLNLLYPEWPHRKVAASHAAVARSIPADVALIYILHEALEGTAHEGRAATSQLDLPSLTPLFVADCGRLQL